MRCKACNAELTDKEATRKDGNGHFYDLCEECLEASYDLEDEGIQYELPFSDD